MSAPNNPHNRAMDLVETAILERLRGNMAKTAQLYAEALELELVAIRELDERGERAEPTWSVLHRSAGWMAFNSHQFDMAAKLARKALAGNPHPEIAEELRDLLKETIKATYAMQDEETMFHIIKSPQEWRRDSAFGKLWRFDSAREATVVVFKRGEQLEDRRPESPPQRFSVNAREFPISTSEDYRTIATSHFSRTHNLLINTTSVRSSLAIERQAPRRHDGGSVSKSGLKLAV